MVTPVISEACHDAAVCRRKRRSQQSRAHSITTQSSNSFTEVDHGGEQCPKGG